MVAQALSGTPERASKPSREPYQVDAAGAAILNLLEKATSSTEENNRRVAEIVDRVIHHLRVAEERIASLQSEVRFYRERSDRAEKWLRRIYDETENLFVQQPEDNR